MNLTGPFFSAQAAGRHMVKAGRGRIINTGTLTGLKAYVRRIAYGASRAGMIQFTRNLALELASSGVTVNSVAPDYMKAYNLAKHPELYEKDRLANPMQRFATEEEVAAAIIFLASDEASFITGQTIVVDGGQSL
jgi:3-oxoacyl-[acyl-carrier protein] reductase